MILIGSKIVEERLDGRFTTVAAEIYGLVGLEINEWIFPNLSSLKIAIFLKKSEFFMILIGIIKNSEKLKANKY